MEIRYAHFLIIVFCLYIAPATAQQVCGKRADIVKRLSDKYRETQRTIALDPQQNVVETFASETGTWTAILSYPNGSSCILSAGENWQMVKQEKPHF